MLVTLYSHGRCAQERRGRKVLLNYTVMGKPNGEFNRASLIFQWETDLNNDFN